MLCANSNPLAISNISELTEINQLTREIQVASLHSDWILVAELAQLRHSRLLALPLTANDAIAETLRAVLSMTNELTEQVIRTRADLQVSVMNLRRGSVGAEQYLAHST